MSFQSSLSLKSSKLKDVGSPEASLPTTVKHAIDPLIIEKWSDSFGTTVSTDEKNGKNRKSSHLFPVD